MLSPDACLCTGRLWIATDASTQISLRVHQRITTAFRWRDGQPRCCHIHISNPYSEMAEDDVGFPTKMAQQSYQYLQERIKAQREQIRQFFHEDAYRIGGDEFVVITDTMNRADFQDTVRHVREGMNQQGIYCSVGVSWRNSGCIVKEQFEETDRLMYQDKQRFYSDQAHDRRRGR